MSPSGRQLLSVCVRECTCAFTDCFVGQSPSRSTNTCTCTSCRASMSQCMFGSTLSHWQKQLEDICTAVTGVRASTCDVVPLRFIKNTDLTEQTHSGWMSLTRTHIHTYTHECTTHTSAMTIELFLYFAVKRASNEKQVL